MDLKFSILMANYNNARYISESIQSVLSQTYKNWELIIVDDASTDNSIDIIRSFLVDDRIKLIQHRSNLGCGQTKKDCADNSSGDILGELDPDDVLDEHAIEIMVDAYIKNPGIGFIYSTYYVCNNNLDVINVSKWSNGLKKEENNLLNPRSGHFRTFKKSAYDKTDGFSVRQKRAVDRDIIYKLEEITDFVFIDSPLYFYRKNENGISQGKNSSKARVFDIDAKYQAYKRRLDSKILNLTKKEMSNELLLGVIYSIKSKNLKQATFFLGESFKIYPFNVKGCLILIWRLIKFPFYRVIRFFYPDIEKIYN